MKKFLIVLIIVIVLGGAGWFFFLRSDDETTDVPEKQNFPVQYDASSTPAGTTDFASPFNNLSFQHPNNWNAVESAENTADDQLITVESPQDSNGFYFCLDLNMLAAGTDGDFTTTDSKVVYSEQLESGHYAITYSINGLSGLYWSVTDNAVDVDATSFSNELTSDANRLQVFGRFNCREETSTDFSAEHFQNSHWLHDAKSIVDSIEM